MNLKLPNLWFIIFQSEGGRICSFSPCIEQVQKTCESLRSCGFRGKHFLVLLDKIVPVAFNLTIPASVVGSV